MKRLIRMPLFAAAVFLSFSTAAFAAAQPLTPSGNAGFIAFSERANGAYSSYDQSSSALVCPADHNCHITPGPDSSAEVIRGSSLTKDVVYKTMPGTEKETTSALGGGAAASFVFKLGKTTAENRNAAAIRYHNYYYYDPASERAIREGEMRGYVKIDIVASLESCSYVEWRKPEGRALAPYVAIRRELVAGMPRIDIMNTGRLQMSYAFYYAGTEDPVKIRSNLTYLDVDCAQAMAFRADSIARSVVTEDTKLGYEEQNGWHLFSNVKNNLAYGADNPENAVSIAYETETLGIRYYSNQRSKQTTGEAYYTEGKMTGAQSFFGPAQQYSLFDPGLPGDPLKSVSGNGGPEGDSVHLNSMEEAFTFYCRVVIPAGYQPAFYFSDFQIVDELESCLRTSKERIRIQNAAGDDLSGLFRIELEGQRVTVTARPGAEGLENPILYGNGEGETIMLSINTTIREDVTEETMRKHGHLSDDSSTAQFGNTFEQIINRESRMSNSVTVYADIPEDKPSDDSPKPLVRLTKMSDKPLYRPGELGTYTITVEQDDLEAAEKKVVLKDEFAKPELIDSIDLGGMTVLFNEEDITSRCRIVKTEDGYLLFTGTDLGFADMLTVTYQVRFSPDAEDGDAIHNTVMETPEDPKLPPDADPFREGVSYPCALNTVYITAEPVITKKKLQPLKSEKPKPHTANVPDTGDRSELLLFLLTGLTAAAAVIVVLLSRKEDL